MNKIRLVLFFSSFFFITNTYAQVSGISYTLAPSAEYTWWHDNAGIADGLMVGGKLGLGFGEFFELRGSYMQSFDLKNDFESFGLVNYDAATFNVSDVKVTRYGGEVKANLSRGRLLPFVLLGTGIQSIQLNELPKSDQIYLTAGAGIKLGIADRMTLTLEGRNTAYRYNTGANLLTIQDRVDLGETNTVFRQQELTNWSAAAALQFYIGGRKPGEMTELDKAYFDAFNGGASGLNLGIEAVAGQMNFNENLQYRDTWMAGGSAGFDFGPYIGLRGFYWRALEEGSLTTFDDLAMWGAELRTQLNTSGGFTPFLMLGGGKMDINEGYEGRLMTDTDTVGVILTADDDTGFAMGGVGLLIPLSQNFKIFGSARAILTSSSPINDFAAPAEVQTSWFYSAGVKLRLGKKDKNPEKLMQDRVTQALDTQKAENEAKAEALKQEYETKVLDLENALIDAYAEEDLAKAEIIKEQKNQAEQVVAELENRDNPAVMSNPTTTNPSAAAAPMTGTGAPFGMDNISIVPSNSRITMSPAEFENLIEEILEGVEAQSYYPPAPAAYNYAMPQNSNYGAAPVSPNEQQLMQRIQVLEQQLGATETQTITTPNGTIETTANRTETETKLLSTLIRMEQQLKENNMAIEKLNSRMTDLESDERTVVEKVEEEVVEPVKLFKKKKKNKKKKNKE